MISLLKNDSKRLREIILLYMGMLSIILLLSLLSSSQDIIGISLFIVILVMLLVVPILNFDYLHDKTKSNHISSLPLTKQQVFITKYSSGICAIVLPLGIYYLISFLLHIESIPFIPIGLLILIYYSLGCFIAVLSGTVMMHVILYILVVLAPLLMYICSLPFIHGIKQFHVLDVTIDYIVPFLRLWVTCFEEPLTMHISIVYVAYSFSLFGLGWFANHHRKNENIGKGFVFPLVDGLCKSIIIFCCSWIVTSVIVSSSHTDYLWILYVSITLLLSMALQLFKVGHVHIRYIVIQTTVITLFTTALYSYGRKYIIEEYIPSNIAYARIAVMEPVSDKEGIEAIVDIHQQLIKQPDMGGPYSITIEYQETSKTRIYRDYYVDKEQYNEILKTISDTHSLYQSYCLEDYKIMEELLAAKQIHMSRYAITSDDFQIDEERDVLSTEDMNIFKNLLEDEKNNQHQIALELSDIGYDISYTNGNTWKYITIEEQGPLMNGLEKYIKLRN